MHRIKFKILIAIITIFILIGSCAAYVITYNYKVNQIKTSSSNALKQVRAESVEQGRAVDISDNLRKRTAKAVYEGESIPSYSYSELWNMDMSVPSGVSSSDLKLVTAGNLRGLEDAFVKAEQDYKINCLFVMAIASHESANGTMCFRPNNMFGYGSRGFSSKAECIDVVSNALANSYLSPGGSLYSGKRITDVNKRYAASSTWDEKVCRNMAKYYSVISQNHNAQLKKLN